MKNELFDLDKDQKDLATKIASQCGCKAETIRNVWYYTLYTQYLDILENKGPYNVITIPMIGKCLVKPSHENPHEMDEFFIFNEGFKNFMKDVIAGRDEKLVDFFDEHFIDKTVDNIIETSKVQSKK